MKKKYVLIYWVLYYIKMLSDNFCVFVGYYLVDCMLSKGYLKFVILLFVYIF